MNVSPWLSIVLSVCALGVALFALLERPSEPAPALPEIRLEPAPERPPPLDPVPPRETALGGRDPSKRLADLEQQLARVQARVDERMRSPFVTNAATAPAVSNADRLEMAVVELNHERAGSAIRTERDRASDGTPAHSEWLHLPLRPGFAIVYLEALDGQGQAWRPLRDWEQGDGVLRLLYRRTVERGATSRVQRPLVNAKTLRVWYTR